VVRDETPIDQKVKNENHDLLPSAIASSAVASAPR